MKLKKIKKFKKLENKRILITGASSGIGFELSCQLLTIPGVQITGIARNIKTLINLKNSEDKNTGAHRLFPLSVDVAAPENIELMVNEAVNKMGGIDIVICCAGFAYYEQFENCCYEHIKRIYETNVLSPLYTLERVLQKTSEKTEKTKQTKQMKKTEKISFVIMSSALGKFGLPGYALYCSTKYALAGFHDSFRFEHHRRLHFMTVYPIGVRTNFWERIHIDMPLPRPLQAVDSVAKAIINGLAKEKRRVYTSKAFLFIWIINRILPFLIWGYQKFHQSLFSKWLRSRGRYRG